MASGQTQYYGLSQWEAADKVERVDFNSDNAKIDGALHALAEQAGRKADKSTVTNLSSVVSQKADKTALTAAEKRGLSVPPAARNRWESCVQTMAQRTSTPARSSTAESCR